MVRSYQESEGLYPGLKTYLGHTMVYKSDLSTYPQFVVVIPGFWDLMYPQRFTPLGIDRQTLAKRTLDPGTMLQPDLATGAGG